MKSKTVKKTLLKSQLGSIVKVGAKVAKAANKGSDAAQLAAKRAAAVRKVKDADIATAIQRMERKELKQKLIDFDKANAPKKQMGGNAGRSISEKAAARKVSKGKGIIDKPYPSGPEEKGSYIGFDRKARNASGPFVSMKGSKTPRPIQKKGGAIKAKKK